MQVGPTGPLAAPPTPPSGRPPARRGRGALIAAAVVLAAIGGGAAGAALTDGDDPILGTATAVDTSPVTTAVPPIAGDGAEPAADVAAAVGPAVVQIETGSGLGSGFVYDESGLILTAFHVIEGSDTVQVRLADGARVTGEVLGEDPSTDVAVVRIDADAVPAVATLATGVDPEVGQLAVAIGSPFGLDQTVTAGIVSAVGRSAETPGGVIPAIQTDAPINTGNSGGALADRQGRVIGINDSIVTGGAQSTGNLGVGFAIPIDIAKAVADRIVAGEPTDAGFLGVEGADASGERAGAAITAVEPGSPADDAGLTDADVVVAADGAPVSSMIDLAAKVRTRLPGEEIVLTVVRGGDEREVTVVLGAATGS
jgi:putative serine protease PepD